MQALLKKSHVCTAVLVGTCFLLGSTGWIAWLHCICQLADDPSAVDFFTMVLGYVAQAAGAGAYMAARRRLGFKDVTRTAVVSLVVYCVLLAPALLSSDLVLTLAFGYAMNLACGYYQGHYLSCLAERVEPQMRGRAFGAGYAASTLGSWLLAVIAGDVLSSGVPSLVVCVLLAILAAACMRVVRDESEDVQQQTSAQGQADAQTARIGEQVSGAHLFQSAEDAATIKSLVALAAATVVLVSLVKNAGFSFPADDLSGTVNLELSRLFYGIGLVAAGVLADRNRTYALACCGASLVTPFLMLALTGAGAPSVVLWALGYLLFGFFAVWRVLLFADIAAWDKSEWLAGGGLAFGRVGDAAGTMLCLSFSGTPMMLIAISSALFVAAVALLVVLFSRGYAPRVLKAPVPSAEDDAAPRDDEAPRDDATRMVGFVEHYGLSNREQDVLSLVLGKKTNAAIAEELFVSEATVKFHMRNILKKTGCSNRVEVAKLYASETQR